MVSRKHFHYEVAYDEYGMTVTVTDCAEGA
jgi:hypothetical protein